MTVWVVFVLFSLNVTQSLDALHFIRVHVWLF